VWMECGGRRRSEEPTTSTGWVWWANQGALGGVSHAWRLISASITLKDIVVAKSNI